MTKHDFSTKLNSKLSFVPIFFFSLFIIYGTTIPFDFSNFTSALQKIEHVSLHPFFNFDGHRVSFSDVLQNILLFIPLGLLGGIFIKKLRPSPINFFIVVTYGASLSMFVETLQLFSKSRTTSITDVITNTVGTVVGYLLTSASFRVFKFLHQRIFFQKLLQSRTFIPLVLTVCIVIIEILQPFDLALSPSSIYSKLKNILHDPLNISFSLRDDFWVITLYATISYLSLQFLSDLHLDFKPYFFIPFFALPCVLELSQFIVTSRAPELWDIMTALSGITFGILIYQLLKKNKTFSFAVSVTGFFISYIGKLYSPFKLNTNHTPLNMTLFSSEYEQTTMTSLGNVMETAVLFTFGGYLLCRFFNDRQRKSIALLLLLIIIAFSEYLQGWIQGRYPDISDIIVGYVAFLTGMYFNIKGEKEIRKTLLL